MKSLYKRIITIIILVVLLLIITPCLLFISYRVASDIEQKNCYERVGKEYHVSSTYYEISQAILYRVQNILIPGMEREEVIKNLQKIAPVSTWSFGKLDNGVFGELTELDICSFGSNNVILLIFYTKDNKFESVRLKPDD